jgi:hypothetical protein
MKRDHLNKVITTKKNARFIIIIVSLILFVLSCISPFVPKYKGIGNILAVDGSVIKGLKKQEVKITRASSISDPEYLPERNCQVKVLDNTGNEFVFNEESQGKYVASIDDAFLNYNSEYKLVFRTSSGEYYESGYQRLLKASPIDSVYYSREKHYNQQLNDYSDEGLQFYADLDAPDDASTYYKWQMEETWEVLAAFKICGIYDGNKVKVSAVPSDSLYHCWRTKPLLGFYTSSANNLSHNNIKKVPLNFTSERKDAFIVEYCMIVKEFALNKDAYDYWHQKEVELTESGQIYTKQPAQIKSNISNTNNPDEKVLGFFWASSCSEKHLFLKNPWGVRGSEANPCRYASIIANKVGDELENALLKLILSFRNIPKPPVYIYFVCDSFGGDCYYNVALTNDCVDCRLIPGSIKPTNHKPDFWP